jgi:shikimate kinase
MPPLCLVGMSGIGKSFWAQRLAVEKHFVRHDCDGAIADELAGLVETAAGESPVHALGRWMGMPWTAGYAEREARYLALEERVTRGALAAASTGARQHVIDTTGSVVYLSAELRTALREDARVIYLRSPEHARDAMLERYRLEPKPVVWSGAFEPGAGEPPADALPRCFAELLRRRDALYTAMAHVVLDGAALEAIDPGIDGWLAACGL